LNKVAVEAICFYTTLIKNKLGLYKKDNEKWVKKSRPPWYGSDLDVVQGRLKLAARG